MSGHYKSARREINTIRLCDIYTRPHNSLLLLEPLRCALSERLHPLHCIWCTSQSPPAHLTTTRLQAATANVTSAYSAGFETLKHRLPSQFCDVPANSISLEQGEITFSFPVQRPRSEVRHQRHILQDINKSVTIQIQMEISKPVILITFIFSHILGKCFQSNQEQLALETLSSGWIRAPCLTDGLWKHQLPSGHEPGTRLPGQKAVCRPQNGSARGGEELGSLPAALFPLLSSLHNPMQKTAEEGTHLRLGRALGTGPEVGCCIFLALLLGYSKETAIWFKALMHRTGDKVLSCQSNARHGPLAEQQKGIPPRGVRSSQVAKQCPHWKRNIPGLVLEEAEKEGRESFLPSVSLTLRTRPSTVQRVGWPSPQATRQDEKILLCSSWTQWQSNGSVMRWVSQLCAALGFACFWHAWKQSWKSQHRHAPTLAGTWGPADTGLNGSVEGLLAEWDKRPPEKWGQQAPAYPRSSSDTTPSSTKLRKGFAYKSILSIHRLIRGSCPLQSVLNIFELPMQTPGS